MVLVKFQDNENVETSFQQTALWLAVKLHKKRPITSKESFIFIWLGAFHIITAKAPNQSLSFL